MKILHYSLGFPPYRTGGLTKFCNDLMIEQSRQGHEVALLWPGRIHFICKKVYIKQNKKVNGIGDFEIINPLPVPYDEGIRNIKLFTKNCSNKEISLFLDSFKPDVIHVHTFMGLYKEFLELAKQRGIRLVFTTHDYFPICPKVTMYRAGNVCNSIEDCEYCYECNKSALSPFSMNLLQSPVYRIVKNSRLVRILRKNHRAAFFRGKNVSISLSKKRYESSFQLGLSNHANEYIYLKDYYKSMIILFDSIHSSSKLTKSIYEKYYNLNNIKVIPITHADIHDNRIKRQFSDKEIRMSYLGPESGAKGFFLLKEILDELYEENNNFILNIFFTPTIKQKPYIRTHKSYEYSKLKDIFNNTDILIVPSIWYETFGYTVLEALSHGIPVIINNTIGAVDIVPSGSAIIVDFLNKDKVKNVFRNINANELSRMNDCIIKKFNVPSMNTMAENLYRKCYIKKQTNYLLQCLNCLL